MTLDDWVKTENRLVMSCVPKGLLVVGDAVIDPNTGIHGIVKMVVDKSDFSYITIEMEDDG